MTIIKNSYQRRLPVCCRRWLTRLLVVKSFLQSGHATFLWFLSIFAFIAWLFKLILTIGFRTGLYKLIINQSTKIHTFAGVVDLIIFIVLFCWLNSGKNLLFGWKLIFDFEFEGTFLWVFVSYSSSVSSESVLLVWIWKSSS